MKDNKISNSKNVSQLSFFLVTAFLLLSFTTIVSGQTSRNSSTTPQKGCNISFDEVQNKMYSLTNGSKQIVTYAVTQFSDKEDCWSEMEAAGRQVTAQSEIAGVYFFTLSPETIKEIDGKTENFEQYGTDLIAVFWKDPDSGTKLKRYPNNTIDGM